jgi:hypothetical protein
MLKDWIYSDVLKLFSDSAGVYGGFAAVFGNKWFAGGWPSMMNDLHITVKRTFPNCSGS